MPVIVPADQHDVWWKAEAGDPLLQQLLSPFPAAEMSAHPVSTRINSPVNDGPECIVPVELSADLHQTDGDDDTQGLLF
jgi:putative SOS response-associated peptidase YedK